MIEKVKPIVQTLKTILDSLSSLGYNVEWRLLECQKFGVPQLRKRIFIVGTLNSKVDMDNFIVFRYLKTGQKSAVLHHMKLKAEPFRKIRDGLKTIELRLNDEKRQNVQIGDYIGFTLIDDTSQKLTTRVVALHHFPTFKELYASLPKEKLGYPADEIP